MNQTLLIDMLTKKVGLSILLATLTVSFSCTTTRQTTDTTGVLTPPSTGAAPLADDDPRRRAATEKFIEATKMDILGDHQQALNLYKECLKIDPSNAAAFYNVGKIFYDQKQYADALPYAQQAVKIDPKNIWYLDLYGTLLGGMGNYKEAAKVYEQMVQADVNNPDAWYNWAFFTEQNKQYQEAIDIFTQIEGRFGTSEEITKEKVKLWMALGKKDKAAEELQKLIAADPNEPRYYSMLVDFYLSNGMDDKAFDVLQKLVSIDPNDPKANLVLASYYQRKGENDKAFAAFMNAFSNPEMDVDVGVSVLLSYLPYFQTPSASNATAREQALKLADQLTKTHPAEAKTYAIYGDLLYQDDQYDKALENYQQSIALDNSKFIVWQQLFFLYDQTKNYDSLLAVSTRAEELFPDQAMAYYFNGYANLQKKRYPAALTSINKAIEVGSGDRRFLSQMYATAGDLYYNMKNHHASDSCYDMALVFDPSNAYVLNNYAYYLALRGEKLDEALKMSEKSNVLSPNNAAYEDTYGWVLYKLGRYADAKEWVGKALQHGGNSDGTVLEHYGDILFQLGDVNGAVEAWTKAKALNVDSETIDKKIADRRLYE
jgi:tetratricopeptide (TPR) repeat protein